MIVSVSRRTDIPAHYVDWFFNRLADGFALVRNPMRPHQVKHVNLTPESVDGFVFWTKNPQPMLPRLPELNKYAYYFQVTLTAYGTDIELHVPHKFGEGVQTFCRLADSIGLQRVIWRYDPVLLSQAHSVGWHIDQFGALAHALRGFTGTCVFSFVDPYKNTARNQSQLRQVAITQYDQRAIANAFAHIAADNGMLLQTCSEAIDLSEFGIAHGRCIDAQRLSEISGRSLSIPKDRNQRPDCGCAASVDIGVYNSCPSGCLYCYANYNPSAVSKHVALHDPNSPFLISNRQNGDEMRF